MSPKIKNYIISFLIITFSIVTSYFVQDSNIFYENYEPGHLVVFLISFIILTFFASMLFRKETIDVINFKMLLGLILIISDIALFCLSFELIFFKDILSLGMFLLGYSLVNSYLVIYTKFWNRLYASSQAKTLIIINAIFVIINFLLFFQPLKDDFNLDNDGILIIICLFLYLIINFLYSRVLIKLNKR